MQGPFFKLETTTVGDVLSIIFAIIEMQEWGASTYREWFMSVMDGLQFVE